MSPVFVIFCIIAFLIPVCLCAYYKNELYKQKSESDILTQHYNALWEQSHNNNTSSYENAYTFLEQMGKKHQFKVEILKREENWVICAFTFQGGHFLCYASAKNDELLLQFRSIANLKYTPENYEKVRELCNRLTGQSGYTKLIYTYEEENNEIEIHILIESIGVAEEPFLYYLDLCFKTAAYARHELEKDTDVPEKEIIARKRDQHLLIEAEMRHEAELHRQKHPYCQAPNHGTLGEYISYLFNGENVADLLRLTIQNADGVTEIRQRDKIAAYDLLSAIIDTSGKEVTFKDFTPAVLTIETVSNHYVFTLHPLEGDQDVLSVRMTAVCTPHEFLQNYVPDATYTPDAVSMRLCYIKTEWSSKNSDKEQELPKTSIGAQVEHGQQLFQQECYLQAIAVLTPIFKQLKNRFFDLNDNGKDLFFRACYYIGFSYSDLKIYDKAYYYLNYCNDCNRFDYSEEYINCLANDSNLYVFREIDKEQKAMSKLIEEIDNDDDCGTELMVAQRARIIDYVAFLQRRKGYAQINFGLLDDAEETFKALLEHQESHDYAENELKYIEQLRQNKKARK